MKFSDLYHYNNGQRDLLSEDTVNDIRNRTRKPRKDRSKPVISKLNDVTKDWTVTFKSNAITSTKVDHYFQTIRPVNPPLGNPTIKDVRDAFNGDVIVNCLCNDWRWFGLNYWGKQDDYAKGRGKRVTVRPDIRNPGPNSEKGLCKHLQNTTSVVKANLPKILKMYRTKFGT